MATPSLPAGEMPDRAFRVKDLEEADFTHQAVGFDLFRLRSARTGYKSRGP